MPAARIIMTLLAATRPSDRAVLEGLVWFTGLVLAILAAALVVTYVKRRVRAGDETRTPSFTLEELRDLKERGDLTDVEYHALKHKALAGE